MTDKKDIDNVSGQSALRDAPEDQLGKSKALPSDLRDKTPEEIIHELRVHQIELKMQNEELKRVNVESETSRDHYQDLYDFAPVGYFTVSRSGLICRANLTAAALVGMPRPKLIGRGFGHFVAPESLDQWDKHVISVLGHEEKRTCDLTLKREDGSLFYARLESIRMDATAELQAANGATHVVRIAVSDITGLKRTDEALKQSEEEKFRTVADFIYDWEYWIGPDRHLIYVSQSCERITGYSSDEFINNPGLLEEIIHPADRSLVGNQFDTIGAGDAYEVDFRIVTRSGETRWIRHRGQAVYNKDGLWLGRRSSNRDITGRKHVEEQLTQSEERYRKLIKLAPVPLCFVDKKGVIIHYNDRFSQVFGYTPDDIPTLKEWWGLAYPDADYRRWVLYTWEAAVKRAAEQNTDIEPIEYKVTCKNGAVLIVEISGITIEDNFLATFRDITEYRRMEEERLDIQHKLLQTQKLESLAVMAGGIAHDFNNQLAIVLGNLELALTERDINPEVRLSIKNAMEAAKRSAELARKIQNYTGHGLYWPVELDIKDLLNKNLNQLKSTVSKNVTLYLEIGSTLPTIKGDADQIQRLVMNILDNASEAIGDKEGEVTIRTGVMDCDEVYLSRSQPIEHPGAGRFVFLEVTDNGSGMDAETQRQLFDPFFTTKFYGRGLGMAEALGIVKGHHGALMVDSEIGKGTTIRVLFPVSKDAQASSFTDKEGVETKSLESDTVRRKTVLIVEDEAGVRNLVVRRLDLLGYDSIIAEDGEEGVSVFRERMNEIDLVMLDYKMPKMNGDEAFGELIKIKPDVKVILSSGYTEDAVMQSFPGQRPAGVLHKPYKMEDLKGELERLLRTAS